MLPAKYRLNKTADFSRTYQRGKSYASTIAHCKIAPNHLPVSRFGFIVSRKVAQKATQRNLIKRRIREIVRNLLPMLKTGQNVLIIVKPAALITRAIDLKDSLISIFKQAKLL